MGVLLGRINRGSSWGRWLGAVCLVFAGPAIVAAQAAAAPGSRDFSFGNQGHVLTGFGGPGDQANSIAQAVLQQADGKLLAVGCGNDYDPSSGQSRYDAHFLITRYLPNGALDPTYGAGGRVSVGIPSANSDGKDDVCALSAALQPNGKLVAAGRVGGGDEAMALARFNASGTLDTSFGDGGWVVAPGTEGGGQLFSARAVAIQPDGKIVAAGDGLASGCCTYGGIAVARFNPDGSLDRSFSGNGWLVGPGSPGPGPGSNYATSVLVDQQGRVVVAGNDVDRWASDTSSRSRVIVARYKSNGNLDKTFAASGSGGYRGYLVSAFGLPDGSVSAGAIAEQPDGKLVVGGSGTAHMGGTIYPVKFMLGRFTAGGAPDTSFGTGGFLRGQYCCGSTRADAQSELSGLALQPDGRIVFTGRANDYDGVSQGSMHFGLGRATANGKLDSSFGNQGTEMLGGWWSYAAPNALVRQADGKLVMAGSAAPGGGDGDFGLVRVLGGPGAASPSYVALGDSVASGEGLDFRWRFVNGSWTRSSTDPPTSWDQAHGDPLELCHRSYQGYPFLVGAAIRATLTNLSCTGAGTFSGILTKQFHKPDELGAYGTTPQQLGSAVNDTAPDPAPDPQSSVYNQAGPDVVSLSLGADDVSFGDFVTKCYESGDRDCLDAGTNRKAHNALIHQVRNLRRVLREIRNRGAATGNIPTVLLNNYFDPFPSAPVGCLDTKFRIDVAHLAKLSGPEKAWLQGKLKAMNKNITAVASEFPNVYVVDVSDVMASHTFCTKVPWVYGPSIYRKTDQGTAWLLKQPVNPAPFHPTPAGQRAIACRMEVVAERRVPGLLGSSYPAGQCK